jgi:Putative peptidoglycan binding domain/HlyD family secretion protein
VVATSDSVAEYESAGAPKMLSGRRGRRRRRALIVVVVVVVGVGGAAAIGWEVGRTPAKPASPDSGARTGVATVKRQTLEEHSQVDGSLGYEGKFDVINRASGVITGLPVVGRVITSGQVLYRVDGKPIIFLRGGKAPAYRSLSSGMSGSDVNQLNAALVDLGYEDSYGPSADSTYFSTATEDAVMRLQDAMSAKETGKLDLGQVIFLPAGQLRITKVSGIYGASAAAGQSLLQASSTTPQVSIAMDASQSPNVKVGDKVTVSLPNGNDAPGVVSSIGTVATTTTTGSTVPVEVRLADPKATGGLDAASVKVVITSGSKKDVLAVPVTALLAMSGGGYSVEIVNADNTRHLTRVKSGMFDGEAGMVEVVGSGLTEGQRVVVPAS